MSKKISVVITVVFLIIGVIVWYTVQPKNTSQLPVAPSDLHPKNDSETYRQYSSMSGVMYDRNFIANMIAHHQGAIDMSKMAQASAKHQELKDMAMSIIAAQEKEKADLLAWQKAWGFPSTSTDDMEDHSAMGMMDSMATMASSLEGKSGDDFDKAFLEQMIIHHEGAIDMAGPGQTNAQRVELKNMTRQIVESQTKEIIQMKKWQKMWQYNNL